MSEQLFTDPTHCFETTLIRLIGHAEFNRALEILAKRQRPKIQLGMP